MVELPLVRDQPGSLVEHRLKSPHNNVSRGKHVLANKLQRIQNSLARVGRHYKFTNTSKIQHIYHANTQNAAKTSNQANLATNRLQTLFSHIQITNENTIYFSKQNIDTNYKQ